MNELPNPNPTTNTALNKNSLAFLLFGFVLATLASIGVFTLIALNPYSSINPFPPFTPLPIIITATFLPPTATLPATARISQSASPTPARGGVRPWCSFTLAPIPCPQAARADSCAASPRSRSTPVKAKPSVCTSMQGHFNAGTPRHKTGPRSPANGMSRQAFPPPTSARPCG